MGSMTTDDIVRMAREAGLIHFYDSEGHCTGITDAPLFTADSDRNDDRLVEMLAPFAALVATAEREECAKVCESLNEDFDHLYVEACAEAIRARGQA
jgi:hypothetical protein